MTTENLVDSRLHHLQSSRVGMTSLLSTIGKLPNRDVISTNRYLPTQPETMKFKKGIRYLKATRMHIADETRSLERKPCVRTNPSSYLDSFREDNPQTSRRQINKGQFNPDRQKTHYRIHGSSTVQLRTVEDLGIPANRKKVHETANKRCPISKGDFSKVISRQTLWKEERRQRDNGKEAKMTLCWDTYKKTNAVNKTQGSYSTKHLLK